MLVKRFVQKELWDGLKRPEITILLGARQVIFPFFRPFTVAHFISQKEFLEVSGE